MKQIPSHIWQLNNSLAVIYPDSEYYDLWKLDGSKSHYANTWLEHDKRTDQGRMCTYSHQLAWYPTDDEAIDSYTALKVVRRLDDAERSN